MDTAFSIEKVVDVISHLLSLGLIIGLFKSFASYIQHKKNEKTG